MWFKSNFAIMLAAAICFCFIGVTTPTYADLGDPLFKLLANGGAAGDEFGISVAISGNTAIVGAYLDDDNGSESGSAYIFDVLSGQQIAKLVPDDNAAFDWLGWSVAISGTTAIIGAYLDDDDNWFNSGSAYVYDISDPKKPTLMHKLTASDGGQSDHFGYSVAISGEYAIIGADRDNDNGTDSGSAYLFDITAGFETAKLLPNAGDGAAGDTFGFSVAISGQIAIVGAFGDDDNGNDSGSVFLFDISNPFKPLQIAKILRNDAADNDRFGASVAISGTRAIIGAHGRDENGTNSGLAYLYDATTGQQIGNPLQASDAAEGDQFGRAVAISGTTAIVGARFNDDNGTSSGSAYIFNTVTGQQISKIVPNDDGAAGDEFGVSVAISDFIAIAGAFGDDANGVGSGSAYLTDRDSDGDGLLDSWEISGIPYIDGDGSILHYMLPDANPMHKDLYVEVDEMISVSLSASAILLLVEAFAEAPLNNPDNADCNGITLHILTDQIDLPLEARWFTIGDWPVDFDTWRSDYFGTTAEHGNTALLQAKAKAYRYCSVAFEAIPEHIGGTAEIPGDNFILFFGATSGATREASVFMHELGHTLGLLHGGGDGINGKPNYPSIMNYVLSSPYSWCNAFWSLDYSRGGAESFVSLDESSLNETVGIGSLDSFYDHFEMPFGVNVLEGETVVRNVRYVSLSGTDTDFGDTRGTMFQDMNFDVSVEQDLNYAVETPPDISLPGVSSFSQTLEPYNDWANVVLQLAAAMGDAAPAPRYPTDELTTEARDWIDENFPLPPGACLADLDGNGSVDTSDLLALFAQWGTAGPADFDGSGAVDTNDLLILFANWGPCP